MPSSPSAGDTYWALADHLGSVRDVVDNNGTLRIHKDFDSFGNVIDEIHYDTDGETEVTEGQAGYVDVVFGFTGALFDAVVSLQYNRARWYDPSTGRFISEDPIRFAAGDANLNRYVGNQPTIYVDPSGLAGGTNGSGAGGDDDTWLEIRRKIEHVDPWWNDSGWDWLNLGAYSLFRWIPEWSAHSIKQRTAEIERGIRSQKQESALADPINADPEALRPYASDAEIGLMQDYAEAGIQATASGGILGIARGFHGPVSPDVALRSAERWLGQGYSEIAPGVFRSSDGLRQFRMTTRDLLPTHGNIGPHVHFEALNSAGKVMENVHLPVTP